ncbi:hypothetical protein ACJVDH_14240 [Pedobacter sp. AW1-32]|uniref:hypothetical protein n=1 Tax=Pedobacter sp. AW1-32 TaxID=3383026 RepID=UPI003FF14DC8
MQDGKSVIEEDQLVKNVSKHFPGLIISDTYNTNSSPVSLDAENPLENSAFPNTPKNGSYFRYAQIPLDEELDVIMGARRTASNGAPNKYSGLYHHFKRRTFFDR